MSKEFEDQFINSVLTIQRVINSGLEVKDATPQLYMAVEAFARSISLPAPVTPAIAALVDKALAHTRDEFDAIAKDVDRADAKEPMIEAYEHRQKANEAQMELRRLLRTRQQREFQASKTAAEDEAWIDGLMRENPPGPLWEARYDAKKAGELAFKLATERVKGRERAIRPTVERLPVARKQVGGEKKRFVTALLQFDRTRRASRMTYAPTVQTAGSAREKMSEKQRFVSALLQYNGTRSLSRMTRLSTVDTGVGYALVAKAALGVGSLMVAYYGYDKTLNIPLVDDKTILAKCAAKQGVVAYLYDYLMSSLPGTSWLRNDYVTERKNAIRCWQDEIKDLNNRPLVQADSLVNFFTSGHERWKKWQVAELDESLTASIEKINEALKSFTSTGGPATVTPFAVLYNQQVKIVKEYSDAVKKFENDIKLGRVTNGHKKLIAELKAKFDTFVADELQSLDALLRTQTAQEYINKWLDTQELMDEPPTPILSIPTPSQPAATPSPVVTKKVNASKTVFVPCVIRDSRSLSCYAPEVSNITKLMNDTFDKINDKQKAGVNVDTVANETLDDNAPPLDDRQAVPVTNMTVLGSIESATGDLTVFGDQIDDKTQVAFASLDQVNATLEGNANTLVVDNTTGRALAVHLTTPSMPKEPIFEDINGQFGLASGLESRFPPDKVMAYFADYDNALEEKLARFPQLLNYVQRIGQVTVPYFDRGLFSTTTTTMIMTFNDYVITEYAKKYKGNQVVLNLLLNKLQDTPENEKAFVENTPLTRVPTDQETRDDMIVYYRTFVQAAYTVDLTQYWHLERVISLLEQQNKTIEITETSDMSPGMREFIASDMTTSIRAMHKQLCGTVHSRVADENKKLKTLLGREPDTVSRTLRSRTIDGSWFSPELAGKTLYISFSSKKDIADTTPTIDREFEERGETYQRIYAVRDTDACRTENKTLDECPWIIVDKFAALKPPPANVPERDVILADIGKDEQRYAIITIFNNATQTFGPVLASLALGGARIAANSSAAASAALNAAYTPATVGSMSNDPNDDSGLINALSGLLKNVDVDVKSFFQTYISDPIKLLKSSFTAPFSTEYKIFRTYIQAFEALAQIAQWLEIGINLGGLVVNGARLLESYFGCLSWLQKHMPKVIVEWLSRLILFMTGDKPRGDDAATAQLAADREKLRAAADKMVSTSAKDTEPFVAETDDDDNDALSDQKKLGKRKKKERTPVIENYGSMEAVVAKEVIDGCKACCPGLLRPCINVVMKLIDLVTSGVSRLATAFGWLTGFSGTTFSGLFVGSVDIASLGLLTIATPILWTNMTTFASSVAISAGSRIALGAMVDVVAALLGYYAAKSAKVEDRAQKRKLWSDTLLMGGMLGLRMMPWLTSGLYSPIARATTRTPSDAVYDSIYAPSMSSMKTPNATGEDFAIELAVFAGGAVGRMFAAKLCGWIRAWLNDDKTTKEQSIAATQYALSSAFVDSVASKKEKNQTRADSSSTPTSTSTTEPTQSSSTSQSEPLSLREMLAKSIQPEESPTSDNDTTETLEQEAKLVWKDVCFDSVIIKKREKLVAIDKPGCDEMAKVGAAFIAFINDDRYSSLYDVKTIRSELDNRGLGRIQLRTSIEGILDDSDVKDVFLARLTKDVDIDKLQYEWATILASKMEAKPK